VNSAEKEAIYSKFDKAYFEHRQAYFDSCYSRYKRSSNFETYAHILDWVTDNHATVNVAHGKDAIRIIANGGKEQLDLVLKDNGINGWWVEISLNDVDCAAWSYHDHLINAFKAAFAEVLVFEMEVKHNINVG